MWLSRGGGAVNFVGVAVVRLWAEPQMGAVIERLRGCPWRGRGQRAGVGVASWRWAWPFLTEQESGGGAKSQRDEWVEPGAGLGAGLAAGAGPRGWGGQQNEGAPPALPPISFLFFLLFLLGVAVAAVGDHPHGGGGLWQCVTTGGLHGGGGGEQKGLWGGWRGAWGVTCL